MLTRLKVDGFKNLVGADVRFGPFTCIAGANGVGKSNLFDAIRFLSGLADRPLIDAALSVRDEGGRTADIRSLFHRMGDEYDTEMSFEAEMIIPSEGLDDLGQKAKAGITTLRYSLVLAYHKDDSLRPMGGLEVRKEELYPITQTAAYRGLGFEHRPDWRRSVIKGRRVGAFISTVSEEGHCEIKLHQDQTHGRPLGRLARSLPRTVLSVTNAAESPTALLVRKEMQSWRLLQLEPSALRKPDEFSAPSKLGLDGSHLAATLYHLARQESGDQGPLPGNQIYSGIANRLSELIDDVRDVDVDRDERRELLTLLVTGRDGTAHAARSLSDGTLRFLALAVLSLDPEAQGLLCLEEPENGIHPERIPAILRLLQDIVVDVSEPTGTDNPLRQVIINTHSPLVVQQAPDDSLLVAELKETLREGKRFQCVCFSPLPETWRVRASSENGVPSAVSRGKLLAYLNPVLPEGSGQDSLEASSVRQKRRVIDRPDLQQLQMSFPPEAE